MLKIWGRATSSNVQKVLWCCAELGIDVRAASISAGRSAAIATPNISR